MIRVEVFEDKSEELGNSPNSAMGASFAEFIKSQKICLFIMYGQENSEEYKYLPCGIKRIHILKNGFSKQHTSKEGVSIYF